MIGPWEPIATAPRDGTEVYLTWMDAGVPQDTYPMVWEAETENPLVQAGAGIWVMRSGGEAGQVIVTWSEADPLGAPTHWRRRFPQ